MSSNSPYLMLLFTYGYKESSSVVDGCFLAQFGVSLHYPENVGKYRIVFQNHWILWLNYSGENIRYSVKCHNPLILSVGAHGGCHGPYY